MAEAETVEVKPDDLPGSAGAGARSFEMGGGYAGTALPVSEAPSPDDIASIVNPGGGAPPEAVGKAGTALAGITRREIEDRGAILSGVFGRAHEDEERARRALEAEGVGPHELKPWDAEAEKRKHEYDPVQAFGSLGSVFSVLASAFTRRPMINALNSSAAAMEATRSAKRQDFVDAYQAWKDNTELVIKRHGMQHQQYQDAISLMQTNMQLGEAKLKALAVQYGDQKTLAMLENGMSKELFEALDAQNRAVAGMEKNKDDMALRLRKNFDLNQRLQQPGVAKADIPGILRAWKQDWESVGRQHSADQEFMERWRAEHPKGTSEEFATAYGEFRKGQREERSLTADQDFIQRYYERFPDATPEQFSKDFAEFKRTQRYPPGSGTAGGNPNLTSERQIAARVAAERERLAAEKNPDGSPKYDNRKLDEMEAAYRNKLRRESTPLTSGRADQLKGMIDRFEFSDQAINKVEELLKKHKALTGLGGKITRPGEVVTNWFGSNETDRAQFRRYISELQEWGPRLLNESLSRPLSAEETRITAIVAGLNPGDTTANTARALSELQTLFKAMRGQLIKRLEGKWTPESLSGGGTPPPGGASPAANWYEQYQ